MIPTTGPLLMLGEAFGQSDLELSAGRSTRVAYPSPCVAWPVVAAKVVFVRNA